MSFLKCPACAKPCHPKATECKWCGSKIGSEPAAAGPIISREIEEEAQELAAWNALPDTPPPLISVTTWIYAALFVAAAAAAVVFRANIVAGGLTKLSSVMFLGFLGWSLFVRDLAVSKTRFLGSPPDAARYYFNRCENGLYRQAARALVTYPAATERHRDLKKSVQDAGQAGPAKISGFVIGPTDYLKERLAVVEVGLTFAQSSYYWIPFVAGVRVTQHSARGLRKLFAQREGRWYLVNGTFNDRVDRRLAQLVGGVPPTEA